MKIIPDVKHIKDGIITGKIILSGILLNDKINKIIHLLGNSIKQKGRAIMGIRTTTTSSVVVPTMITWKCSKCKTTNYAEGNLVISRTSQSSTSLLGRIFSGDSGKELAAEWKNDAIAIITNPSGNANDLRDSLYFKNKKCRCCKHKEVWARKRVNPTLGAILLLSILPIFALAYDYPSVFTWGLFATDVCINAYDLYLEYLLLPLKKKTVPKESWPSLACLDHELRKYADSINKPIFTYDIWYPVVEAVKEVVGKNIDPEKKIESMGRQDKNEQNKENGCRTEEESNNIEINNAETDAVTNVTDVYCYKCGNKLKEGSEFCSYCGADLREN